LAKHERLHGSCFRSDGGDTPPQLQPRGQTQMKVGFVGLGNQGSPMAERIVAGGFDTTVWARSSEQLEHFLRGPARIAESLSDLGRGLDILGTCVFDARGTREILFGPAGVAASMPRGALIVCHSTMAPDDIVEIAATADTYGLRVLDAPVSGGRDKARAGELVIMAGGDAATLSQALPVLETFSDHVVHLGGVGAGQCAKLLNNALLAAHLTLADDALRLAEVLHVDPGALAEVLHNGSGRSYAVELLSASLSLRSIAQTQARPTLTKDVQLLERVVTDSQAGASLRHAAAELVSRLDDIAQD
jgi:3-hydroxyisobutyrate dehydrogenase